ncbi:hypothetical protein B0A78_10390 [Flavobacterium columnare NBRC 100251 = ATCC 23463]|uniref:hypothetical protein n=1 Tax=Flavobacterium columnare TaxID=996 RepID=UPI0009815949|nr:hypothetical protein [Flavobacterium columnare]MBF6658456.1 hypothetical protein [Flavobacterium columnare]OOB83343.1 hypothetical protein BZL53_06295 [Flavobacterium columnare]PDS23046.1 hypothetical protein B0A78_10390 [Flavobacterium columnare NBRC 100251 = ATCC 23463]QOG89985.1 hypothetical protein HUE41_08185 [Flavobacterium columnare]QOG92641.1 hypothetical protein HUE42_08180 [Flavobacterium columnare]
MKEIYLFSGMFLLFISPITCTENGGGSYSIDPTVRMSEEQKTLLNESNYTLEYTADGEPIIRPKKPE